MNLLKKYIAKNKTGYFFSILLAVLGVLAGLFTYVLLSKMIVALIAGNTDFAFYTKGVLSILALLCAKEVFMGIPPRFLIQRPMVLCVKLGEISWTNFSKCR